MTNPITPLSDDAREYREMSAHAEDEVFGDRFSEEDGLSPVVSEDDECTCPQCRDHHLPEREP